MKRRRTTRRPRPPMGVIQAHIETFSHDCRGIARIEGKASFIQDALPGEEVEFRYTNIKRDYSEGQCTKVLTAAPIRVEPKCPHVSLCGGCSLQHLDVSEQIKAKQDILINLFQRVGRLKPETLMPPLTAESWNYRNKARLSVRYVNKKNSAMVGFREKNNPKFITDIEGCSILNSKVDRDIIHLRNLVNSLEARHSIAQIEVAAGDTEVALIFRNLTPLISSDEEKLRLFAEQFKYRMFLQPDDADSIYAFYPPDQSNFLSYELPHHQLTLHFHPNDFIQVNAPLNRLMVDQAIQLMAIEPEDTVLDLFCGLGNFSLPLAKYCSKVTGIEGSQAMVERARMNAELNQLDNTAFYLANLDDPQQVETLLKYPCNKLLIDPPRSGALEIVRMMNKLSPERIVYISCNPVTLARDADILVNQHGYHLKAAGVMDMFPNTSHVESIALFVKG